MGNLFEELRRRNVFRVGIAYAVVGWVLVQVTALAEPAFAMPDWVDTVVFYFVLIGFPITLLLAWAFEMTPEGVKKTKDVNPKASIAVTTGKTLEYLTIAGLVVAVGFLLYDRGPSVVEDTPEPAPVSIAAPAEDRITIAVLAFADLSAAGDQEYFGDGIAEEIINRLVSIEALKVTSRTSAFSFKDSNLPIPEIAAKLDARYVLEGSVRSAGNQLRITAQLIEVASDSHLWSETYDRELDDIFAIQDDISASIANTLEVQLVGGVTPAPPTTNLEAYQLYLQGHHLFLQRGINNLVAAIGHFEEAVMLDPKLADAWADMAASSILLPAYDNSYDLKAATDRAVMAANRALAINPDLAQGWAAMGYSHVMNFKWAEARTAFSRAVELNPNSDTGWLWRGLNRSYTGHLANAEELLGRAVEIAPQSGINNGQLGRIQMMRGNSVVAQESIQEGITLGWVSSYSSKAVFEAVGGNSDQAAQSFRAYFEAFEEPFDDRFAIYLGALDDPTKREVARALLAEDLEQGLHLQSVFGSLLLGDGQSYVYALENLSNNPVYYIGEVWHVPYRSILNQQPVKDYLVRIGLAGYWRDAGWPDFCRPVGTDDFECN